MFFKIERSKSTIGEIHKHMLIFWT